MSWDTVKLGDICEFNYGKGLPKRNRKQGPYPVYGSGGLVDYHNEYIIKGPGIIIGRKGTIGKVYFVKNDYCPIDTVFYIEENDEKYDLKFLFYMLQTIGLETLNSDAAVPGLNRNVAYLQIVNLPSLTTQHKIASILSAYDDLIENNTRRIKILEEMAQTIYKEWFVNFRFPGHEKVKFVDLPAGQAGSPLGKIPEGWEVTTLENLADITSSKRIYAKEYVDNGVPFYRSKEIIQKHHNSELDLTLYISNKKFDEIRLKFGVPTAGDLLLTSVGTLGVPYLVKKIDLFYFKDGNLIWFRSPARESSIFLYYWILSDNGRNELLKTTIGSSQPAFTIINLKKINIVFPSEKIIKGYNEIATNLINQIDNLSQKNKNLRKTRDLLLPKLMSGEVPVSAEAEPGKEV